MRIGLMSDSHLEEDGSLDEVYSILPERGSVDVYLVAGDATKAQWAYELCTLIYEHLGCPVLFTPGNHEYYYTHGLHCTMNIMEARWELEFSANPNVHYLQNSHIEIGGVSFFGATWWTNFMGKGWDYMEESMAVSDLIADFRFINVEPFTKKEVAEKVSSLNRRSSVMLGESHYKMQGHSFFHKITAQAMIDLNSKCIKAYRDWFEGTPGTKVLMSHFPMLKELQHAHFEPNPYFVSADDILIQRMSPDVIVFGHTHYNYDKQIFGSRCVSNQLGYRREFTGYQKDLVVTV